MEYKKAFKSAKGRMEVLETYDRILRNDHKNFVFIAKCNGRAASGLWTCLNWNEKQNHGFFIRDCNIKEL